MQYYKTQTYEYNLWRKEDKQWWYYDSMYKFWMLSTNHTNPDFIDKPIQIPESEAFLELI